MLVRKFEAELNTGLCLELLVLVALDADAEVVALRRRLDLRLLGRGLVRLVCCHR